MQCVILVLDANGKFPSGSLTGKIKSIGRLEECLESRHPLDDYSGKYCLMLLNFDTKHGKVSPSWNKIIDETMGYRRNLENGKDWLKVSSFHFFFQIEHQILKLFNELQGILLFPLMTYGELGVCLPSSCTSSDMLTLTQVAINRATKAIGIETEVSLFDKCIDSGQNSPYTKFDYGIIALFAFTFFITAIASFCSSSDFDDGT